MQQIDIVHADDLVAIRSFIGMRARRSDLSYHGVGSAEELGKYLKGHFGGVYALSNKGDIIMKPDNEIDTDAPHSAISAGTTTQLALQSIPLIKEVHEKTGIGLPKILVYGKNPDGLELDGVELFPYDTPKDLFEKIVAMLGE